MRSSEADHDPNPSVSSASWVCLETRLYYYLLLTLCKLDIDRTDNSDGISRTMPRKKEVNPNRADNVINILINYLCLSDNFK